MADITRLYEGLILLNQQAVASDFDGTVEYVRQVISRDGAEIDVLKKWEERKLAYPIDKQKRGTFLLTYFKAGGDQITRMERDFQLSEQVLRTMFIRADHVGDVELAEACKEEDVAPSQPKPRSEPAEQAKPAEPVAAEPVATEPVAVKPAVAEEKATEEPTEAPAASDA